MTIRYVTVDQFARVLEVTNLIDEFGNDTTDPNLAASCVIKINDEAWRATAVDGDIPIYTVH